jgi:two-component system sensor histidine kinase CreC
VRALTHELKSPMTAIAGAAELMHDELPAADRQGFAREIRDQVARQRALVERLLELSKLEHRSSLEHAAALDLGGCADAAIAQAEPRARQLGITMRWARRDAGPVFGETELLQLAIANLIENALDFAPPDSSIEFELRRDAQRVRLLVRDHGSGVEDYALARLGQRFFSTPRPAKPGEVPRKGSGLGLAIVREIVALHRGALGFSNAAPGLRVEIDLPVR